MRLTGETRSMCGSTAREGGRPARDATSGDNGRALFASRAAGRTPPGGRGAPKPQLSDLRHNMCQVYGGLGARRRSTRRRRNAKQSCGQRPGRLNQPRIEQRWLALGRKNAVPGGQGRQVRRLHGTHATWKPPSPWSDPAGGQYGHAKRVGGGMARTATPVVGGFERLTRRQPENVVGSGDTSARGSECAPAGSVR